MFLFGLTWFVCGACFTGLLAICAHVDSVDALHNQYWSDRSVYEKILEQEVAYLRGLEQPRMKPVGPVACQKEQPFGWSQCTRDDRHDGPCALWPEQSEA